MAQPTDTSAIQRLIGRARVRIRRQWALEGATTAVDRWPRSRALASIFCVRTELGRAEDRPVLLGRAGLIVIAGAVISAMRRLDDETVARRIDRASNLADRLSTAIAFQRALAAGTRGEQRRRRPTT